MLFRILFWRGEVHTSFAIYAGPKEGALRSCGIVVLRNDEFEAFRRLTETEGAVLRVEFVDEYVKPAELGSTPPKKGKR